MDSFEAMKAVEKGRGIPALACHEFAAAVIWMPDGEVLQHAHVPADEVVRFLRHMADKFEAEASS